MLANQGDTLRFMGDYGAEPDNYKRIDLKEYDWGEEDWEHLGDEIEGIE